MDVRHRDASCGCLLWYVGFAVHLTENQEKHRPGGCVRREVRPRSATARWLRPGDPVRRGKRQGSKYSWIQQLRQKSQEHLPGGPGGWPKSLGAYGLCYPHAPRVRPRARPCAPSSQRTGPAVFHALSDVRESSTCSGRQWTP